MVALSTLGWSVRIDVTKLSLSGTSMAGPAGTMLPRPAPCASHPRGGVCRRAKPFKCGTDTGAAASRDEASEPIAPESAQRCAEWHDAPEIMKARRVDRVRRDGEALQRRSTLQLAVSPSTFRAAVSLTGWLLYDVSDVSRWGLVAGGVSIRDVAERDEFQSPYTDRRE